MADTALNSVTSEQPTMSSFFEFQLVHLSIRTTLGRPPSEHPNLLDMFFLLAILFLESWRQMAEPDV